MGTFDDAVNAAMEVWFGDDMDPSWVTYDSIMIPAHVQYGENREDQAYRGGNAVTATLEIRVEDVAQPVHRDAVVIDGVTWYVAHVVSGDGYTWILSLERDVRPTFDR